MSKLMKTVVEWAGGMSFVVPGHNANQAQMQKAVILSAQKYWPIASSVQYDCLIVGHADK